MTALSGDNNFPEANPLPETLLAELSDWVKSTTGCNEKSAGCTEKLVQYGLMIEIMSASLNFTNFMICCFQWN